MRAWQIFKRLGAAGALGASPIAAQAYTFDFGDDRSLSVGYAMRYSYTNADSPNGTASPGHSTDFHLDSGRFLFGASLNKYV